MCKNSTVNKILKRKTKGYLLCEIRKWILNKESSHGTTVKTDATLALPSSRLTGPHPPCHPWPYHPVLWPAQLNHVFSKVSSSLLPPPSRRSRREGPLLAHSLLSSQHLKHWWAAARYPFNERVEDECLTSLG